MNLYSYQKRLRELILAGKSVILQAPTGAGKTRASLTPFLDTFWDAPISLFPKKCVYIVPMRVLANQFTEEMRERAGSYGRIFKRDITIGRQTGEYREDPEFHRDLTFATIDQVLSSWLLRPYSQSKRKWNLNAGAFVGSYLIFDEFHLFDPDSTLPTTLQMLKTLKGISPFVLMTATFSKEMLQALANELNAEAILLDASDLADIPAQKKTRIFHTVSQPLVAEDAIYVEKIVETHLAQNGRQRSLVVCNQVERAQLVYQTLRDHPQLANVHIRLVHSRFLQKDRQGSENEIRIEFHKDHALHTQESMIVVGTQVVEVGLDMSCRALHTELAPGAAILQRAGRCARYQGEVGDVYVYYLEPDKRAPYNGKEAKQQCELTWHLLQEHEGEHLDFSKEQDLINFAHTPTDRRILAGLQGTEFGWRNEIYDLWQNDSSRGEASRLIRDIQAVSVVIHADPDQLAHAPFKADSFSLHPGTLQGKYQQWKNENESKDPDWDDGRLPWLAKRLEEIEEEADIQGNYPIRYQFPDVRGAFDLYAPLVVLNPALVSYTTELGLVLSPEKFDLLPEVEPYQSAVPEFSETQERAQYGYKLESYEEHIRLVHQAFAQNWQGWIDAQGYESWLDWVTAVGARIEHKYNWQAGIVAQMAQLVVCLHDLGKLSQGWQGWAREWQAQVGHPLAPGETAAHTDYDPTNKTHKTLNRKLGGKRPTHAVESAYAAYPLMYALLPDNNHLPLFRAAFTAVARHHGPFSAQPGSYALIDGYAEHVGETAVFLPFPLNRDKVKANLAYDFKAQRNIDRNFLIQPDQDQGDMVCYTVFVRALRHADQEGTKRGSK
ncbi:MAG: CRISPR-associated helicase Cas3' [Ardenticatenaceae bacterium]|nr:CRISPR-associated helicase Cas3' [Ardenticatenaceae bacterium]